MFISHCDFTGNSAILIYSIANELALHGVSSAVAVPQNPDSIATCGRHRFQVFDYAALVDRGVVFPNGRGPDLVHAWGPREMVRKMTDYAATIYKCPFVVYLEDHEEVILENEFAGSTYAELCRLPMGALDIVVPEHRVHPIRYKDFLKRAGGVTALIDTLLEFKPTHVPGMTFPVGYEPAFLEIPESTEGLRKEYGIASDDIVLVYTGNVHDSNLGEVKSLYLAAGLLRKRGMRIKLIKAGWNQVDMSWVAAAGLTDLVVDLGFVNHQDVPLLLSTANYLVQPGTTSLFNDYRFPSKLPEYFASGRPVVLPYTNVGRWVKDGEEAVVMKDGHAQEIADKVEFLARNPELARRMGAAGRRFAERELAWSKNVPRIKQFYEQVVKVSAEGPARPADATSAVEASDAVNSFGYDKKREAKRLLETRPELPVKLIAFYLPQYHPIPENDEWWGKGFTEWRSVSQALPNFTGHYQPHIPADLGFYDLRVPEVMDQQAELAKSYGLYGFCFYYYWFNGHRLLERPLNQMLERGKPEFPFCICWANESWTRRWDGSAQDVLIAQEYSDDFDERFIRDAIPVLTAPHYIRVNGAPLLLVYRIDELPEARRTADCWRQVFLRETGLPLHLAIVQSFGVSDPRPYGFDSAVEFPPHTRKILIDPQTVPGVAADFTGHIEDYRTAMRGLISKKLPDYSWYRGVMPMWDNTARRGRQGHAIVNSSPSTYATWLRFVVDQALTRSDLQEPLVFINAWNEWAEGAHLEPDQRYGHRYLQATKDGLSKGILDHYRIEGCDVKMDVVEQMLAGRDQSRVCYSRAGAPAAAVPTLASAIDTGTEFKTSKWFSHQSLQTLARRYREFPVSPLSYGTVQDFCDSIDHLTPLTQDGDLTDNQRPWVLKAILSRVPRGGRVLEIGAGEPFVADILYRLGYEVWIADPYDGSGQGPIEFERYRKECPHLHFVRSQFNDEIAGLSENSLDCVYSISVLEHIPDPELLNVFKGMKKYLRPDGIHIHTVDYVHKGKGTDERMAHLLKMVCRSGLTADELQRVLKCLEADPETYYISAESHNRLRGSLPYSEFPMRVCVSIQIVGTRETICGVEER